MTTPAEELASKLGGRKTGAQWRARCPAHDDRTPSLGITDSRDGTILLRCYAGCSQGSVIDALKRDGLWPARPNGQTSSRASMSSSSTWTPILPLPSDGPRCDLAALLRAQPSDHWDYLDAEGRLLGYIVRLDGPHGKKILPVTYCAGPNGSRAWRMQAFSMPRPLYGLRHLAQRTTDPVLVVEGEKTACAAAELFEDFVVVTWPGGAKAVDRADWTPLKERAVTLWPDADAEGLAGMDALGAILEQVGVTSVRRIVLPDGLPRGWDLADKIPSNMNPRSILNAAHDQRQAKLASLPLGSASDLVARHFEEPKWAIPQLVPEGLTILGGKPKTGKSWAALDFAVAVAGGYSALGNIECQQGNVLLLALEDNDRRLNQRLKAVLQGQPAPRPLDYATRWRRADAGGLEDLATWLSAHPHARLVVIDTLEKIRGERSKTQGVYADDYRAVGDLKALADRFAIAILVVHHLKKGAEGDPLEAISGTAGITGSADTILVLKREPKDTFGTLYVRGRDVLEAEIAMQFDDATGKWLRLIGADDFRRSKERNDILRTLIDLGEQMAPADIAEAIGKPRNSASVRMLLSKMRKAGDVIRHANRKYTAANP